METKLFFYLGVSALASLLLVLILVDLFLIIKNKNQRIALEKERREAEISDLLSKQEILAVNAAFEAQDRERQRIARELHDNIGASLSLAKMQYSEFEKSFSELQHPQIDKFREFSRLLSKTTEDVRRISHDLHDNTITQLGMADALRQLCMAIEQSSGTAVRLQVHNFPGLEYRQEINLYRIVQELLSNTLKHSGAGRVDVQFIGSSHELNFTYEDDGRGFESSRNKSGIGLQNIGNRMALLGATWALDSKPGQGMVLTASIPLSRAKSQKS